MIGMIGGPDRDRTDDLFHAMEARSQLRHRPTVFILRPQSRIVNLWALLDDALTGLAPACR